MIGFVLCLFLFPNQAQAQLRHASNKSYFLQTSSTSSAKAKLDDHRKKISVGGGGGQIGSNGQECYESGCYSSSLKVTGENFIIGGNFHNGCGPWHTEADKAAGEGQDGINLQDGQLASIANASSSQAAAAPIQRGKTTMVYIAFKKPINFNKYQGDRESAFSADIWYGAGMLFIEDLDPSSFINRNVVVQRGTNYPVVTGGASLKYNFNNLALTANIQGNVAVSSQDPTFSSPAFNGPTRIDVGNLIWWEWSVGIEVPILL